MSTIYIKSIAKNRVRLKSNSFKNASNIALIENEFGSDFIDFRENLSAKSIIFKYNTLSLTLDEIMQRLNALFNTKEKESIELSSATCNSLDNCNSCVVKKQDTKSWKRKLVEFGLLSAYSLYLFVAENILGISIAATPLSLVALVSVVATIPLLKSSLEDIKNEIHKLIELDVKKGFILIDDIELEVKLADVKAGDIVVSRNGEATVNEALIKRVRKNINFLQI